VKGGDIWRPLRDRVILAAMSIGRLLGLVLLVIVLYSVISQPLSSAAMVRSGIQGLGSAGTSLTQFMSGLGAGAPSGGTPTATTTSPSGVTTTQPHTAGQVSQVPVGGAATGDGSTEPDTHSR